MEGGYVFYAIRPPGFPSRWRPRCLFLGYHAWTPAILNCLFYIATSLMAYHPALLLTGNKSTALMSLAILAAWPCHMEFTGLAASDPMATAMGVFWLFLQADRKAGTPTAWPFAAGAGALTGLGALVKPQMQMLPFLMFLCFLWPRATRLPRPSTWRWRRMRSLGPGARAVRNYHRFGQVVIIFSNGGDVFYRANNPLATRFWEKSLDPYLVDELRW